MKENQPIIVGLDIGTTKIAAIAGRKNEYGKLEIIGFGRSNSNGVKHGQVLNIDETIKAIKLALDNCYASNSELEICDVYVGIAGHHIKSLQTRGDIVRQSNDEEITQREIDQMIADQYKTYIPAGDQIMIAEDVRVVRLGETPRQLRMCQACVGQSAFGAAGEAAGQGLPDVAEQHHAFEIALEQVEEA